MPAESVSDQDVAELLPLLPALVRVMNRLAADVPPSLKSVFQEGFLAPRHLNVLVSLSLTGTMSVTELSEQLGVGLPSASLLVAELSRVGLVVRTEDETNRRRTLVDLAPEPRRAVADFLTRRASLLRTALQPLTPAERVALLKGLHSIVDTLESAAERDD
jgi:DNA-binding MarR family transcriptional regulator